MLGTQAIALLHAKSPTHTVLRYAVSYYPEPSHDPASSRNCEAVEQPLPFPHRLQESN